MSPLRPLAVGGRSGRVWTSDFRETALRVPDMLCEIAIFPRDCPFGVEVYAQRFNSYV